MAMAASLRSAATIGRGESVDVFRTDSVIGRRIGRHPVKHSGGGRSGSGQNDQARGKGEAKHGEVPYGEGSWGECVC